MKKVLSVILAAAMLLSCLAVSTGVTVKGAKKVSATVKKLRGGKKYYVRVRAY